MNLVKDLESPSIDGEWVMKAIGIHAGECAFNGAGARSGATDERRT